MSDEFRPNIYGVYVASIEIGRTYRSTLGIYSTRERAEAECTRWAEHCNVKEPIDWSYGVLKEVWVKFQGAKRRTKAWLRVDWYSLDAPAQLG